MLGRDLVLALTLLRDAFHQAIAEVNADKDAKDPDAMAARQQARGALEEVHDVAGALLAMGDADVVWLDPGRVPRPACSRSRRCRCPDCCARPCSTAPRWR